MNIKENFIKRIDLSYASLIKEFTAMYGKDRADEITLMINEIKDCIDFDLFVRKIAVVYEEYFSEPELIELKDLFLSNPTLDKLQKMDSILFEAGKVMGEELVIDAEARMKKVTEAMSQLASGKAAEA